MQKQFLEAGKIVNTHGVTGEIKVQPWCDSPEVLTDFDTLYLSPTEPVQVKKAYVHKNCVVMRLTGVDTCEAAEALKNRILYLNRDDVELPEDLVFIQDILGLTVFDTRTGETIGTLRDVNQGAGHDLYIIRRDGKPDALIPACKPFLKNIDLEKGIITVETIEGLIE
ncbi:ribosome maturation factor RimM [Intestinibacillus sp. Marseille-P6563]|uniref:ribosome maturation factor RimM n=1 Tax=Intestinibacillus sp. Marseille-P6563 TaxID=2364792 RepID=UPI000F063976|nr:ribosome maturation factor RimM [Intestinibacillus sp. Marseille-P6563]